MYKAIVNPPEIREEGGSVVVNANVNLHYGLCATPSVQLCTRCNGYTGDVKLQLLKTGDPNKDRYVDYSRQRWPNGHNAKSIMDLLTTGATKDTKLEIRVTGADGTAREFATSLYYFFSSTSSYHPKFTQFTEDVLPEEDDILNQYKDKDEIKQPV